MIVETVTITGADNATDPKILSDLQRRYPFVEWGILHSYSRSGTPLYPDHQWIKQLVNNHSDLRLSAHFCGGYSREVLENKKYNTLDTTLVYFDRVQINYNFSYLTKYHLVSLFDYANKLPDGKAIILQFNQNNSKAIFEHMGKIFPKNLHLLYDSSGGKGRVLDEIREPFPCYTGYSGGLSPDNILHYLKLIDEYRERIPSYRGYKVWVDMEKRVRTGDQLDIKKVERVLSTCADFLREQSALKLF